MRILEQMIDLFFLHNPKAAGIAIHRQFKALCDPDDVSPTFAQSPKAHRSMGSYSQYEGYRFYHGHYGYDVYEKLGLSCPIITNFRNPVSRVHSLYRYWRHRVNLDKTGNREVVRHAHEKSFSNFIRTDDPDLQLYLRDAHFRQLWRSPWEFDFGDQSSMGQVKTRIDQMPWFFVCEYPDLSMLSLHHSPLPDINIRSGVNASPMEDVLTPDDASFILSINQRDIEVYSYAVMKLLAASHSAPEAAR